MICPVCGGETKVVDSRPSNDSVRRRRECLDCGVRFDTLEHRVTLLYKGGAKV
jgi:transcriptional repressor NrdR